MSKGGFFSSKITLVLVCAALIVASSVVIYYKEKPDESHVKASGTVEVTEVYLAPLAGGRLEALEIEESDHVHKGQFIARLSMDGADDDLKAAESALAGAKAQLEELQNGYRAEDIAAAQADTASRRVQYEQAKRDERRFTKLASEGVVARRDAELYVEQAKAAYHAMRAAEERQRHMEKGPRPEKIAAAEAEVSRAQAAYRKAKTLVGYKELYCPVDGVVLTKNCEVGDVVNSGTPLATIGDMNDCWVKLYIPSTQLALVKLGAKCDVRVDPFPDKSFEATVTEVNQQAEYNPRMSLTQKERANMVFWIKISFKDTEGVIKPGMLADVTIL